jgi:dTDP-3-amino-3,4,6-trideoxy-alpha-D-glucose transaminase
VKLRHLDEWNRRRARLADLYFSRLSFLETRLALPVVPEWASPVWHLFVIRHDMRDRLQQYLADHGIQTAIHYPIPPHLSAAYRSHYGSSFPVAEEISGRILSLPCGPHFTTDQIAECADQVVSFVQSHG